MIDSKPLGVRLDGCRGALARAQKRRVAAAAALELARTKLTEAESSVTSKEMELQELEAECATLAVSATGNGNPEAHGTCLDSLNRDMTRVLNEMQLGGIEAQHIQACMSQMSSLFGSLTALAKQQQANVAPPDRNILTLLKATTAMPAVPDDSGDISGLEDDAGGLAYPEDWYSGQGMPSVAMAKNGMAAGGPGGGIAPLLAFQSLIGGQAAADGNDNRVCNVAVSVDVCRNACGNLGLCATAVEFILGASSHPGAAYHHHISDVRSAHGRSAEMLSLLGKPNLSLVELLGISQDDEANKSCCRRIKYSRRRLSVPDIEDGEIVESILHCPGLVASEKYYTKEAGRVRFAVANVCTLCPAEVKRAIRGEGHVDTARIVSMAGPGAMRLPGRRDVVLRT